MAESHEHRMAVVSRGELDNITKPASSRSRPGSKVSQSNLSASSNTRSNKNFTSSLELLAPEQVLTQDFDLELEEFGSSESEYTTDEDSEDDMSNFDTGRSSAMFGITEPLVPVKVKKEADTTKHIVRAETKEYQAPVNGQSSMELALVGPIGEDEFDIDSDEERDIIKEIKAEITKKVKEELKGELAIYKSKKDREAANDAATADDQDLDDIEPDLRAAIIKMRKLDRILAKRIKREKAVKRERILLTRKLREELANIKPDGEERRDVKANTEKFLALALPPSHDEGVSLTVQEETSPAVTPVFQTQVLDQDLNRPPKQEEASGQEADEGSRATSLQSDGTGTTGTSSMSGQSKEGKRRRKKNKNFIKRNMELAADAANTIAMTDDEKKRLEDLLGDLEALPEIPEEEDVQETSNPYQVCMVPGEGFRPPQDEAARLTAIDARLKALLPAEDYESISSTPQNLQSLQQSDAFTRVDIHSALDVDKLGEGALRDVKGERALQERLHDIEQELGLLTSAVEMEIESPTLTEGQLQDLLDQCARTMSRATAETDTLAQSSRSSTTEVSRASIYENPPYLPNDVLQQLLAEARSSMSHSRATSQREGETTRTENNGDLVLESINEEKIQELLMDSRTTSRSGSRASAGALTNGAPGQILNRERASVPSVTGNRGISVWKSMDDDEVERKPFLPEINPKGMLTQRPNNQRLNNEDGLSSRSSTRTSAIMVRNSLSEAGDAVDSQSCDQPENATTPHPPNGGKRTNSGGKSRTFSPAFTKNSFE